MEISTVTLEIKNHYSTVMVLFYFVPRLGRSWSKIGFDQKRVGLFKNAKGG